MTYAPPRTERGRSSGVEHDLAKVGVEGSNPFARSNLLQGNVSLGSFGLRFSVCIRYIFGVHLGTSKVQQAAFSLSGEGCVSEAWDLGDLVYKV